MFGKNLKFGGLLTLVMVLACNMVFAQFASGDGEKEKNRKKELKRENPKNLYFMGGWRFPSLYFTPYNNDIGIASFLEGNIYILDQLHITGITTATSNSFENNDENYKHNEISVFYAPVAFFSENRKLNNVFNKTSIGVKGGWLNLKGYSNEVLSNFNSETTLKNISTQMFFVGLQRQKLRFNKAKHPTRAKFSQKLYLDFIFYQSSTGILSIKSETGTDPPLIEESQDISAYESKNNFGWRAGWSFYSGFKSKNQFINHMGFTGLFEFTQFPGVSFYDEKPFYAYISFGLALFI